MKKLFDVVKKLISNKYINSYCMYTRSVQKIRGLFELRGSSWFQDNPLGVARFVQINWLKPRFPVADIFICW